MQISVSLANRFEEQGHLANALCLYYSLYMQQPNNVDLQNKVNHVFERLINEEEVSYNSLMKKIFSPTDFRKFAILPSKSHANFNEMRAKLAGNLEIAEEYTSENDINEEELTKMDGQQIAYSEVYDETKIKEYAKEVFNKVLEEKQKDIQIDYTQTPYENKANNSENYENLNNPEIVPPAPVQAENNVEDIYPEPVQTEAAQQAVVSPNNIEVEKPENVAFEEKANKVIESKETNLNNQAYEKASENKTENLAENTNFNKISYNLLDLKLSELSMFLCNLFGEDKQLKDITLNDIKKIFK